MHKLNVDIFNQHSGREETKSDSETPKSEK